MIEPLDLALAWHWYCESEFIPRGISPQHDVTAHSFTTEIYANTINGAGLDTTPEDVVQAIIAVAEWDRMSPWPGHPHPDKVVEYLKRGVV